MKFGEKLVALQNPEWIPFYLDYNSLKQILEDSENDDATLGSHASGLSLLSSPPPQNKDASMIFLQALYGQVEKIVLFYLQELGRIAYQLVEARQQQQLLVTSSPQYSRSLRDKYQYIGRSLVIIIQYVDLNMTGIRKILKKHDKTMRWRASPLFLSGHRNSAALLQPLLQEGTIEALFLTLETSFTELRQLQDTLPPAVIAPRHIRSNTDPAPDHTMFTHRRASSFRDLLTKQHQNFHPDDSVLAEIQAARKRLQQSSEFVNLLAATELLLTESSFEENEFEQSQSAVSNILNLMSTFLYMTNYYVVVPTAGTYAAKLGSSSTLASLIVGMTPIAALVSTLLYSWWTSYSYKSALIFASTCSLLGNLCYASGLPYNSLGLVMMGRLMNGFGSARSINRRYIADSFSHVDRTAASAAFVTAGAMGLAAGPALTSALSVWARSSESPYWQVENAPGWVMFVVWSVYLACLIFYFVDPPKRTNSLSKEQEVQLTGEEKPLLPPDVNGQIVKKQKVPTMWGNRAVIVTFLVYFVLKLLLECVLSSTGIISEMYFQWSGTVSGVYLAALGLLMLPANLLVSFLAQSYGDRELIMVMQLAMVAGCLLIMDYRHVYTAQHYMLGSITIFLSTNMLEGPNMSLLSKTIPKSWSEGFFNVGLLATEAGTLGRAVGDVFLTVSGAQGMEYLLNNTFGALAMISFATLILSSWWYDHLQPLDDKDD